MPAGDPISYADTQIPLAAWTDYVPVFTTSGGGANVGSTGYSIGRYSKVGRKVRVTGRLLFNGTGANGGSGGAFTQSLPVAAAAGRRWIGHAYFRSTGGGGHYCGICVCESGDNKVSFREASTKDTVDNGIPFSWTATGMYLAWSLTYESAS